MKHLKQESHHSSIFNCHKQEEKEESTTTIVVLYTAANGDGINVRSKRHNLQHEWSFLWQPEAPFSGALVLLSAVQRGNIDHSNGTIFRSTSSIISSTKRQYWPHQWYHLQQSRTFYNSHWRWHYQQEIDAENWRGFVNQPEI
jgi:hypothetical protein